MCDIDAKTRRKRYNKLIKMGYTRGWAQRARDFTDIRFEQACNNGHRIVTQKGGNVECMK